MGDIRRELLARMADAERRWSGLRADYELERSTLERRYQAALAEVSDERRALQTLLDIEEKRARGEASADSETQGRLPLAEFITQSLADRGPMKRDELRSLAEAAGYFSEGQSAGRAINTTLINLNRAKRIIERADGTYKAVSAMPILEFFAQPLPAATVNGEAAHGVHLAS